MSPPYRVNSSGAIAVGLADRLALLLVALAGLSVVVKPSAIPILRAMSSSAAAYRLTPPARTMGAIALVLAPGVCLMFGLAPLQSFLGFGLGGLLLVGSFAATRRRRTVYAAVALALLLVGMVTAPLPLRVTDDNGEWMGDYEDHTSDRANFESVSGYTSIPFPHHLTALVLKALDAALGATATSPARAFRWLSALAGGLFVVELPGIAMLEGWSAGALRYLALCVAAPVTLLFFGFREIGCLSLSAAGIPLLLRGFSGIRCRSTVIAAACVIGLRSALHGFERAADARFGPVIDVRWVENLGDARRTAFERALRLYRAEHREGSTWRYQAPDVSPDRLRAMVAHDMVADTGGFDRGSLELDAPAGDISQFMDYRPNYTSGWHPAESDATAPESTWR